MKTIIIIHFFNNTCQMKKLYKGQSQKERRQIMKYYFTEARYIDSYFFWYLIKSQANLTKIIKSMNRIKPVKETFIKYCKAFKK